MRQISGFVGPGTGASTVYQGASALFANIAADVQGDRAAANALTVFFAAGRPQPR